MKALGELFAILGKVVVWWLTRNERNRQAVIDQMKKAQDGWENENGDIFGGGRPADG